MPELKAPICRFNDSNNLAEHSTHHYPFATLGPLESHVQPQYVVFNAAQKFARLAYRIFELPPVLKQIASPKNFDEAYLRIAAVVELYSHWTKLVIPDGFVARSRPRSGPSDDADNDDQDQNHADEGQEEPEEKSEAEESGADNDKLQSAPLKKSNVGRQLHDNIASTSSSGSLDTAVFSEDTTWVERINDWTMKCCDAAASEGGWESSILNENDEVLAAYAKEKSRSAPPPDSWHRWQPYWARRNGKYPPHNTAKFSSNDWALFERHTALPIDSE